jgi:hypothetical protein
MVLISVVLFWTLIIAVVFVTVSIRYPQDTGAGRLLPLLQSHPK